MESDILLILLFILWLILGSGIAFTVGAGFGLFARWFGLELYTAVILAWATTLIFGASLISIITFFTLPKAKEKHIMKIAMWGPSGAGKTTYLTRLCTMAMSKSSKWTITTADEDSKNFKSINVGRMIEEGLFPPPNQVDADAKFYQFNFVPKKVEGGIIDWIIGTNEAPVITIGLADVAGERYLNDPLDSPLWQQLADSDGLICLIDPANRRNWSITDNLLESLQLKLKDTNRLVKNKLPHYVAFCFSKIDQPEFIQYSGGREEDKEELIKKLAFNPDLNLHRMLAQHVLPERLEYFFISSIGTECKPIGGGGEFSNPEKLSQINLLKPFTWLMDQIK